MVFIVAAMHLEEAEGEDARKIYILRNFLNDVPSDAHDLGGYNFILNCFVEAHGHDEEPDDHKCAGSRGHFSCQFVIFRHTWRRLTG